MANFDANRFQAKTIEWATPQPFFDLINAEFGFTLDPCATAENAKCAKFYTKEQDGLKQSWKGHIAYCNPPYGNEQIKWLETARLEAQQPNTLVACLIPARTNTNWFHNIAMKARELRFLQGRLKFGDASHGLPQPLVLVVFDGVPGPFHAPIIKTLDVRKL